MSFCSAFVFTFHNVSINTRQASAPVHTGVSVFTFHNVSINTHRNQSEGKFEHFFTFHNVSINTKGKFGETGVLFKLYIPQCFY